MSVICYIALNPTLGCLRPGCDIMQGGEPSAGSGPNETHTRIITVSGRKLDCWELQSAGWSNPIPTPIQSSSFTSWLTDGRTCWPKKWRKRRECGLQGEKKKHHREIYGCLLMYRIRHWGVLKYFYHLIVNKCVRRGSIWLRSVVGLCNVSIWRVCLQGLWNGGSQIVRGKVMRMSEDGKQSGYKPYGLQSRFVCA